MKLDPIKEPSTWAGFAAAFAGVGPLFFSQPVVGAVVAALGAVAVALRERGQPPKP